VNLLVDTSVLVASFYGDHEHHAPSIALLAEQRRAAAGTATHCLAEFYAVVTGMPGKERASPDEALLFLRDIGERLTLVSLDGAEYQQVLETAAHANVIGGGIYHALVAQCAYKAKARTLYTWSLKHFERLGSNLSLTVKHP
jgi:predicted nucleic acid-binding protein